MCCDWVDRGGCGLAVAAVSDNGDSRHDGRRLVWTCNPSAPSAEIVRTREAGAHTDVGAGGVCRHRRVSSSNSARDRERRCVGIGGVDCARAGVDKTGLGACSITSVLGRLVAACQTIVAERRLVGKVVVAISWVSDSVCASNDDVSSSTVGGEPWVFAEDGTVVVAELCAGESEVAGEDQSGREGLHIG